MKIKPFNGICSKQNSGITNMILKRLALVVLGIVGMFVVMEGVFRMISPIPGPCPLGDRSPYLYMPDKRHDHVWSASKQTNEIRIAVIGDSFTVGSGVQVDDRYANRLESMLNMKDGVPDVDVDVFAKCGTSTFQQVALLDEALKWEPQIVILGICLNDMEDWSKADELERWRKPLIPQVPPAWIARPLHCSRALTWLYGRIEEMIAHRNELRYYRRLYNPAYSGVTRFRDALSMMNNKCRKAHIAFVPVIFPLLSEPFQKGRYPFEYAHESIHRLCDELNIQCLDLLSHFRVASPDRLQVIPGFDPHPNEIAHRMIAESVLLYLISNHFLPPSYSPALSPGGVLLERIWHETIRRMEDPLCCGTSTQNHVARKKL